MVAHLSILLHAMPQMLKEIVTAAAAGDSHVDLRDSSMRPDVAGSNDRVDVVLSVCADPNDRAIAVDLLARWLASGVVLMTPSGQHAVMYEFSATPFFAGDVSAAELLRTIRLKFCATQTPL